MNATRSPINGKKRNFKVAVINSHPIQYFAPLYEYLSRNTDLDITAIYCTRFGINAGVDPNFRRKLEWDLDLLSGYESEFLPSSASEAPHEGFLGIRGSGIAKAIQRGNYDLIWLHGYNFLAYIKAFCAAKRAGIPIALRGELHLKLKRRITARVLHATVGRVFMKMVDLFFSIGQTNRAYYEAYGVPSRKIFDVPYSIDNERFIKRSMISVARRQEIQCELGLKKPALPVVLFAGKFIERKNPDKLLYAVKQLQRSGREFATVMVGSGLLEPKLKQIVAEENLQNVVFPGFQNQSKMPEVYAASDIFILPSTNEPWGLAVNEAMCAALPIVGSAELGCAPDLIRNGENGFQVDPSSVATIESALNKLLSVEETRRKLGLRSQEMIRTFGYHQCAEGILKAVNYMGSKKKYEGPRRT